jgi:hypothetical protein
MLFMLLTVVNNTNAQTVTKYDGEYATDLTVFTYNLTRVNDPDSFLDFYWGFNKTGDTIRFELGTSVLSEDYIDVYYDDVYKIPMDIYFNDEELDVNVDADYFDYWQEIFWNGLLLPVEDGQYNIFDILEDQDPANWDVKGDDVSYFTTESEWVYDYNSGIAQSWTNTVSYDFTLSYVAPPDDISDEGGGFIDELPLSSLIVFAGLMGIVFVRKLTLNLK